MKKLPFILPFLFIVSLVSAQNASEGYTLRGQIQGGSYDGYIYLKDYFTLNDSVLVIDNQFEFSGYVEIPRQGSLHLDSVSYVTWVFLENSDIDLTLSYLGKETNPAKTHGLKLIEITGSETAIYQERYRQFYQANQGKENLGMLVYEELFRLFREFPDHPFSGQVLGDNALIRPVLSLEQIDELYQLLDTTAQDSMYLDRIQQGRRNLRLYGLGMPFSTFSLPEAFGDSVSNAILVGKITLVDFWASWCGPCRIKHPELIELHEKFQGGKFEMIGISIDSDSESWLKAIEEDQLPWMNVLDYDQVLWGELGLMAIPFTYLLDEQGAIIALNPSLELLDKLLEERLSP